jgi:NitT/TauT family transport system substrate-binding protein
MNACKRLAAALIAAAGLAGLAGTTAAAAEPFRLIVTDLTAPLVPNSVMDLAVALGYFAREGVEVELVRVQQTPSALAALQAGEGEMANISVDAALQLVARNQLGLKAIMSPNKALPFVIAARDDIAYPEDLEGRSFAIGRIGSLDHTLSAAVLRSRGVDPDTLRFVAIGQPNVRAQALAAGQVDAPTMSIGVWMSLPDRSGLHVLVDQDTYYIAAPVLQKVNVVPDAVLEARRDDVAGVARALTLAARDFARNPKLWIQAMTRARPDVSPDDLEVLARAFAASWSVNGGLSKGEIDYTVDWLYESPDFADLRRPELAEWVDFSVLDGVLADVGVAPGADQPAR